MTEDQPSEPEERTSFFCYVGIGLSPDGKPIEGTDEATEAWMIGSRIRTDEDNDAAPTFREVERE